MLKKITHGWIQGQSHRGQRPQLKSNSVPLFTSEHSIDGILK